jgi:hypothetical protein
VEEVGGFGGCGRGEIVGGVHGRAEFAFRMGFGAVWTVFGAVAISIKGSITKLRFVHSRMINVFLLRSV